MTQSEYAYALYTVFSVQMLILGPMIAAYIYYGHTGCHVSQAIALGCVLIAALAIEHWLGHTIDIRNRLSYLYPNQRSWGPIAANSIRLAPFLACFVYLYLLRKPDACAGGRPPWFFRHPSWVLTFILLFLFGSPAVLLVSKPEHSEAQVRTAYWTTSPSIYYFVSLLGDVKTSLAEKRHHAAFRDARTGHVVVRDSTIQQLRTPLGVTLVQLNLAAENAHVYRSPASNWQRSDFILALLPETLRLMNASEQLPQPLFRINPLNFMFTSNIVEAALLGIIEHMIARHHQERYVAAVDRVLYQRVDSSMVLNARTYLALRQQFEKTKSYQAVVEEHDHLLCAWKK